MFFEENKNGKDRRRERVKRWVRKRKERMRERKCVCRRKMTEGKN